MSKGLIVAILIGLLGADRVGSATKSTPSDDFDGLVKKLASQSYEERQQASQRLEVLAYQNPKFLLRILKAKADDPEVRTRLAQIVNSTGGDLTITPSYREEEGKASLHETYAGDGGQGYCLYVMTLFYLQGETLIGTH